MKERIQGVRKSVAAVSQRLVSPETWVGAEGMNVLQVLCDLLDLVQQMNVQLAIHPHGATPVPDNASAFAANSIEAIKISDMVVPVTL